LNIYVRLCLQSESTFRYICHMPTSASTHKHRRCKQHCTGRQCGLYTAIYIERKQYKHVLTVALTMHKVWVCTISLTTMWKAIASYWLQKQRSAFVCFANFLVFFLSVQICLFELTTPFGYSVIVCDVSSTICYVFFSTSDVVFTPVFQQHWICSLADFLYSMWIILIT